MEVYMLSVAGGKAQRFKGEEAVTKLRLALKAVDTLLGAGTFEGAIFVGDASGRITIANIKE